MKVQSLLKKNWSMHAKVTDGERESHNMEDVSNSTIDMQVIISDICK